MTLEGISALAAAHALEIFGGFHAQPEDTLPKGTATLLLLGPREPGFWPHLTTQPEWLDGAPDPVDRWSRRVIGRLACALGAKALFPFGGPPWQPFQTWALRSGRAWESPVRLLVHDRAGLFVSFRGALALTEHLALPAPPPCPCLRCEGQPCRTACPPRALTDAGYDLAACHDFLDTAPGEACMTTGCGVRRACPVSLAYARMADQSKYHMRQFHR
ncbi:ferredoxin [Paracoccaceae bacterium Fryx2]|nr:ferredoxin [Paracoccaceae bacterium Fryx2]